MTAGMLRSFLYVFLFTVLVAGCARRVQKDINDMSFAELKTQAMVAIEKKKDSNAVPYLEKLITQYPDNEDIFEYKFILADLYMKEGKLESAYRLYRNYVKMYPSEKKAERAHYNSILAKYYQSLKVHKDCDQEDTAKTMKLCKNYLSDSHHKAYRREVLDLQYTCERKLIDKEVYIFNTYLQRNKLQSAQHRLDHLRTAYADKHPALRAQLLYLEAKLAQKQKNDVLIEEKAKTLLASHPDSEYTQKIQRLITSPKRSQLL